MYVKEMGLFRCVAIKQEKLCCYIKIVVTGSPFVPIHVVKAPVRRIIPRMANFALASGYRLPYQENIVEHITFSEKKMVNKASKSKGLFT